MKNEKKPKPKNNNNFQLVSLSIRNIVINFILLVSLKFSIQGNIFFPSSYNIGSNSIGFRSLYVYYHWKKISNIHQSIVRSIIKHDPRKIYWVYHWIIRVCVFEWRQTRQTNQKKLNEFYFFFVLCVCVCVCVFDVLNSNIRAQNLPVKIDKK